MTTHVQLSWKGHDIFFILNVNILSSSSWCHELHQGPQSQWERKKYSNSTLVLLDVLEGLDKKQQEHFKKVCGFWLIMCSDKTPYGCSSKLHKEDSMSCAYFPSLCQWKVSDDQEEEDIATHRWYQLPWIWTKRSCSVNTFSPNWQKNISHLVGLSAVELTFSHEAQQVRNYFISSPFLSISENHPYIKWISDTHFLR